MYRSSHATIGIDADRAFDAALVPAGPQALPSNLTSLRGEPLLPERPVT